MSEVPRVNGVEDALLLLGRLDESDRRWILERLPPAVKARLADSAGKDDVNTRLTEADAGILIRLLRSEPAWLVHAVLSAKNWPWKLEVLAGLPPTLRMEVTALSRTGVTLAQPAVEFLLNTVCERLSEPRFAAVSEWQFEGLVAGFARGERR